MTMFSVKMIDLDHCERITSMDSMIVLCHDNGNNPTVASETLEGMFFLDYSVNITHRKTMVGTKVNTLPEVSVSYGEYSSSY